MAAMLKVPDVLNYLRERASAVVGMETVPIVEACGRYLAEDQTAALNVPPVNKSAMDGFAVRYKELVIDCPLPVSQRIPAGHVAEPLKHGNAARVFTGSDMPDGADTVVVQENCTYQTGASHVTIHRIPAGGVGDNVRIKGEDIRSGEVLLEKGQRLRAQELGLLASIGISHVSVVRRLKVAIVSTGDELVNPGVDLKPGQIFNSSQYLVTGLLQGMGIEVIDAGCAKDDPDEIESLFTHAANHADCVVSMGGVSVGEEDHVKRVLSRLGHQDFWKVAVKPGKPMAYGSILGKPFFGLPGNPVSTFISFLLFTKPYLKVMQGGNFTTHRHYKAEVGSPLSGNHTREEYLRGKMEYREGSQVVMPLKNQGSGVLTSTSRADVFIVLPVNSCYQVGDLVDVIPIGSLLS